MLLEKYKIIGILYLLEPRDNEKYISFNKSEKIKDTAYSLYGKWFEVDSDDKLCYCGNPVDTSNSYCLEYDLCINCKQDLEH